MSLPAPAPIYYIRRIRRYVSDLWSRREFAWFLAFGNLKARNASTVFGLFWWILNPLLLAAVYYLVFGLIFRGDRGAGYLGYLISGMFVFHFTNLSMTGGVNSILANSKLLANLKFPRLVLPISGLIEAATGFLVSLVVLFLIIGPAEGTWPGVQVILLLAIFPLHCIFNLGLSALTARLTVPFRDLNNLVPYVTRLWLYLTPVIWPLTLLDQVSDPIRVMITINPMFSIIGVYRSALLGLPFEGAQLGIAAMWAVVSGVVGLAAFIKYEGHMVRYL